MWARCSTTDDATSVNLAPPHQRRVAEGSRSEGPRHGPRSSISCRAKADIAITSCDCCLWWRRARTRSARRSRGWPDRASCARNWWFCGPSPAAGVWLVRWWGWAGDLALNGVRGAVAILGRAGRMTATQRSRIWSGCMGNMCYASLLQARYPDGHANRMAAS